MLKTFDHNSQIDSVVNKPKQWPEFNDVNQDKHANDHFTQRDGQCFAGIHLIIDLFDASNLDNLEVVEKALRDSVVACGATLLHIHLHHFTPNGGVSGVAVLAESHISVHTWPEANFAAFDVFMCGDTQPQNATEILQQAFSPSRIELKELLRGENIGE